MTYVCYLIALFAVFVMCYYTGRPISNLNDTTCIIIAILTAAEVIRFEIAHKSLK